MDSRWFIVVAAMFVHRCSGLNLVLKPSDTAREIGTNVTLVCIVTDRSSSENVQWKHNPVGSDSFNALSFNDNILSDPSRYSIQWTYNLTINDITPDDAGVYRCTAGGNDYDAVLTVVVPQTTTPCQFGAVNNTKCTPYIFSGNLPQNVTITMEGEPINGEVHNVTCVATNGLPPPMVTWLVNGVDMTSSAITQNTSTSAIGYGDVISYLPLSLDASINGHGAECILSYKGWQAAIRATYTINTVYPGGFLNTDAGFYTPGTYFIQGSSSNTTTSKYEDRAPVNKGRGFLLRFIKQNRDERIDWEIQQSP